MHLKKSQKQMRLAAVSDNVSIKEDFVYGLKEAKGVPGLCRILFGLLKCSVGLVVEEGIIIEGDLSGGVIFHFGRVGFSKWGDLFRAGAGERATKSFSASVIAVGRGDGVRVHQC